jgi:hypothetical protein
MADLDKMTPEQVLSGLSGEMEKAQKQHFKECEEIVEHGRAVHGNTSFDEASQIVGGAFKDTDAVQSFMGSLRQFDKPAEMIMHLANNEGQLKALAKLSPARQAVELARIESRFASHGHVSTGGERDWKRAETRSGRVSDEDWSRHAGSNLTDTQWSREFDRRMAARNGR